MENVKHTHSTTVAVARAFCRIVEAELSEHLEEIRAKVDEYGEGNACPTHDYCDGNMLMEDAMGEVLGRDPLPSFEEDKDGNPLSEEEAKRMEAVHYADMDLWNEAWTMANAARYRPDAVTETAARERTREQWAEQIREDESAAELLKEAKEAGTDRAWADLWLYMDVTHRMDLAATEAVEGIDAEL